MKADYSITIDDIPEDPKHGASSILLDYSSGEQYSGNVITMDFLRWLFKKNENTGECANGSYFCMPQMIVVKEIKEDLLRITIDDLIKNKEFNLYFTEKD